MRKTIGFFSGKGGTGKTTCSLNTALALHQLGEKVIAMDADMYNANLGLHLGSYDFPVTMHDVLEKDINLLEAVHIHSSGLRFIPASIALREVGADLSKLKKNLDELDYITIFDGPPGVDQRVLSLMTICDEIVVVTNPNIPAVTDALKIIQKAIDLGKEHIGVIVNMSTRKHELSVEEIERVCKVPVLGTIAAHTNFKKSLHEKIPLVLADPYSPAALSFKKIACSIAGKEYKAPKGLAWRRFWNKY